MGTIFVLHIADVNLSLSCRDRHIHACMPQLIMQVALWTAKRHFPPVFQCYFYPVLIWLKEATTMFTKIHHTDTHCCFDTFASELWLKHPSWRVCQAALASVATLNTHQQGSYRMCKTIFYHIPPNPHVKALTDEQTCTVTRYSTDWRN